MYLGASTSHKLTMTASVAGDIEWSVEVVPVSNANPPVVQGASFSASEPASYTGTSPQDVVAGAASTVKRLSSGRWRNNSSSVTTDLTFSKTDGTNTDAIYKCTLLPGELVQYDGAEFKHYDANGALYGAVAAPQYSAVLMAPHFATANLTSTKTITSNSSFAVYIGKAPKSLSSIIARYRVTTAAATITWAELALAKGSINVGGNPTLTVVGFADVAAVINSTGQKSTTINVSAGQQVNPGDDLWLIIGNQATTAAVVRAASIADDIQVGVQASLATRPSTIVGSANAFTIEGATALAAWIAGVVQ